MATLGEAFIAVHADMSPFRREIKEGAQKDLDILEDAYGPKLGKIVADAISDGASEGSRRAGDTLKTGLQRDLGNKRSSPWISVTAALAGALDDGISALPMELKAALVGGILLAAPLIAGGIAGAIGAGVTLGLVGLGVALVSQFDVVQTRWQALQSSMRNTLVGTAQPFIVPLLEAFDQLERRIDEWSPMLFRIFRDVAKFIDPIVNAILDTVEYVFQAIEDNMGNIDVLGQGLVQAIYILGDALSEVLDIILSLGDDGRKAFLDMVYIVADTVVAFVQLIAFLTKVYNLIRDIVQFLPDIILVTNPLLLLFKGLANSVDAATESTKAYSYTNVEYVEGVGNVITATKDEEKQLKELEKAILDAQDAAIGAIQSNVDWERGLDELTEALKENGAAGRQLRFEEEEGRRVIEALTKQFEMAAERAKQRADEGVLNSQQLQEAYNKEIAIIYARATAEGVSKQRIDEVYGSLLKVLQLPQVDNAWAKELASLAAAIAFQLEKANRAAWNLPNRVGGPQPFAEGGIVRSPTVGLIGEAGTEVVIPMTRPARAAELMRQSGLDRMFGGSGEVMVQVFLGNEAFDQHVQKIVVQDNRMQARQLTYGAR